MDLRIGQTWTDRKGKRATSSFTILKLYTKTGKVDQERAKGVLICGVDAVGSHLRDLHVGSVASMFPYLLFDPENQPPEEDK